VAFPHHAVQEKGRIRRPAEVSSETGADRKTGNAVAESENIVVDTAERIFADLADAQTINRDSKGGWKAPLWHALTEAGLPLSWVAAPAWPKGSAF
jgi:acyl-CoA dehydrogenase